MLPIRGRKAASKGVKGLISNNAIKKYCMQQDTFFEISQMKVF